MLPVGYPASVDGGKGHMLWFWEKRVHFYCLVIVFVIFILFFPITININIKLHIIILSLK